jgi:hypothetical protein
MPTEPFKPLNPHGLNIEFHWQARVAHALEFIAAQLGEINERLANEAAEMARRRAEKEQQDAESRGWSQAPGGTRPAER